MCKTVVPSFYCRKMLIANNGDDECVYKSIVKLRDHRQWTTNRDEQRVTRKLSISNKKRKSRKFGCASLVVQTTIEIAISHNSG